MGTSLSNNIKQILSSSKGREFIRFVIVGVIATGIHYGVYYIFEQLINVNVAYTIGFVFAIVIPINFLLVRFVFKSKTFQKQE